MKFHLAAAQAKTTSTEKKKKKKKKKKKGGGGGGPLNLHFQEPIFFFFFNYRQETGFWKNLSTVPNKTEHWSQITIKSWVNIRNPFSAERRYKRHQNKVELRVWVRTLLFIYFCFHVSTKKLNQVTKKKNK